MSPHTRTSKLEIIVSVPLLNGLHQSPGREAIAGIVIAHLSHLLSVLMLHELTLTVCSNKSTAILSRHAFLTACLHIITPAGILMSAPYAESSFSFLTFAALYLYARGLLGDRSQTHGIPRSLLSLLSGLILGAATTFRGNGLLSGLIFVYDAINSLSNILRSHDIRSNIGTLFVACFSGILMACVAFLPQYLAFKEYCYGGIGDEGIRPWCSAWVPSIYTWVQKEYW